MKTKIISHDDERETEKLLLGRRIVSFEYGKYRPINGAYGDATGKFTLDNGTEVYVHPNEGGCACSAGDYELDHLAKVDNIITSVRLDVERMYGEDAKSYRIYVVADAVEINAVQVDGDDGNGYYGTGYDLTVVVP